MPFLIFAMMLVPAAAISATVTFLAPQQGSQAIGIQSIEVATDAAAVDRVELYVDGALAGVVRRPPFRMTHDFGASLAAHELVAKVYSNRYQTVDTARITTAGLTAGESIDVDLVEVSMRLRASSTVAAGDLRLVESGVEQTIREVRAERGPARFVFVIDRSLSMGGGKLAAILRAVDDARTLLRSDDSAEIVLFNHVVAKPRPIARGESLAELFGEIVPSGGTSLRDAVSSIAGSQRTYAIVITDGGDRNSLLNEEDALRLISGTKSVVDAIILGSRSRFLDRAAENTGGEVVTASRDRVAEELRRLIQDINGRYLLIYQSHGTPRGWRTIRVTARGRGIEVVSARKGYFAQ